jgi:hypothetical protein
MVYVMAHIYKKVKKQKMSQRSKQPKKRITTKQKLLNALEECHGVVTTACKKAGLSRAAYYKIWNSDENFRQQCDEIQESAIDFVESQLFKQIQEGNITGQIFYLKTKGKNRGYIEKTQIQQETTGSIQFDFN